MALERLYNLMTKGAVFECRKLKGLVSENFNWLVSQTTEFQPDCFQEGEILLSRTKTSAITSVTRLRLYGMIINNVQLYLYASGSCSRDISQPLQTSYVFSPPETIDCSILGKKKKIAYTAA